ILSVMRSAPPGVPTGAALSHLSKTTPRPFGVAGPVARVTIVPGKRETRVECESPIHQGLRGINILAETPEYHRRPAEHTRVVGRKANSPPGQLDRGPVIFFFIAIIGPVVVFKINTVGSGLSKSGAVARFAHNRLLE